MNPIIFYTKPQIAEVLGMSERTFQRAVNEAGIKLVGHYFTEENVEQTKKLIENFYRTKVKIIPPPPKIPDLS